MQYVNHYTDSDGDGLRDTLLGLYSKIMKNLRHFQKETKTEVAKVGISLT